MTHLDDTLNPEEIAARLQAALMAGDLVALGSLLDENVRWGGEEDTPETCHTRSDLLSRLAAQRASGVETEVYPRRTP